MTLQLLWTHQGYFGGFYVADKKGFYAEEGLRVSYLEGGPDVDQITPVLDGRAQFGIAAAPDLIVARAAGKPVRAIATILRRTPTVYVSKADSGIGTPEDFRGKTIRVSSSDTVAFLAMMNRAGIGRDEYRIISLPSDVELFKSGRADVWSVYANNFAIALESAGLKLNYVYPDDYGVHFYADTLFTTDRIIATEPDLVRRFLKASLKGWKVAVEEPGLVGSLVAQISPRADATAEALKMRATQPLVNTGEDRIGWMKEERWEQMAGTLKEQGLLAGPVSIGDVFTMEYLERAYEMRQ